MMPQDSLVQDALKSIERNKAFQLLQKYKINDNHIVERDDNDENDAEVGWEGARVFVNIRTEEVVT